MKSLVSEFVQEKKREHSEEQALAAKRTRRGFVGLAVASLVCAAAWLAPVPPPGVAAQVPPARFTLASGRMTLVLAARRIESFRSAHRRLPSTLVDAGVNEASMAYTQTTGGGFVLRLQAGSAMLSFDSSMSPAVFVDDAKVIVATGK